MGGSIVQYCSCTCTYLQERSRVITKKEKRSEAHERVKATKAGNGKIEGGKNDRSGPKKKKFSSPCLSIYIFDNCIALVVCI